MKHPAPISIQLKDYRQPDFWISDVFLDFNLHEVKTIVKSVLSLKRNESLKAPNAPLVLVGEKLKLLSVKLDGRLLSAGDYEATEASLTIPKLGNDVKLEIEVEIDPKNNLSCEGLYQTAGTFCTQCEAESFRRITYFLDRPDVMATYTVRIEADKAKYPILLSNGNPTGKKDLGNGRHEATWHDPHKKPSYLFALVAGDLGVLEDTFRTKSGRDVKLQIYARRLLLDRCQHAMDSLKWSMKWDEDTYGLEYDLDLFMIFCAEEFNMGAMENKGLNVFNASYVLANAETATDTDYDGITAVVGHEYFHNWTGNRVTCRDWFQLSLKEGLTVFRDQRFSADFGSEAVNRIEDVVRLRTNQFAEDAGPMAHPIRPQSYISIDNFYTMTVYEKGAEVIRMIETIVGRDGFRKGMDLYFKRHDGQAVTTEDFIAAMADANEVDLTQFRDSWYNQAGTPHLKVETTYNAAKETYVVKLAQSSTPSPGQATKAPHHIPVAVGLLGKDGKDLSLQLESGARISDGAGETTLVLHLRKPEETFTFVGVKEKPVLSLLRKFSAPVKIEYARSDDELAFIMANDSDSFSRWEAAQLLSVKTILGLVDDIQTKKPLRDVTQLVNAFGPVIKSENMDAHFKAFMLSLPAEQYLAQFFTTVDVDAIYQAREHVAASIVKAFRSEMSAMYDKLAATGTEGREVGKAGLRALRSRLLDYLVMGNQPEDLERAAKQRQQAKNMTDEIGALNALKRSESPVRQTELRAFYQKWNQEPLVMNKWLMIQAMSPVKTALADVKALMNDPVFDKNNPNKISSLITAFGRMNTIRFNDLSGEGYRFVADQVLDIDSRNPQTASRVASCFNQWKTLDLKRQALIKAELERILAKPGLSSNVFEIVSKALNN